MLDVLLGTGSVLGGVLGGAASAYAGYKANERNIEMQRETNQMNERLMREGWSREDNAVQRRTWDLKAAGLSPVLAAGSAAAASNPIKMDAPQGQDWAGPAIGQAFSNFMTVANMAKTLADVKLANASADKVDTEDRKIRGFYELEGMKLQQEILTNMKQQGVLTANEFKTKMEAALAKHDYDKAERTTVNPRTGSQLGKMAADAADPILRSLKELERLKDMHEKRYDERMDKGRLGTGQGGKW